MQVYICNILTYRAALNKTLYFQTMNFEIIHKKADKLIQHVVNLTSVTHSSLTLSPQHRFDASHLLTVPLQHIHELSMHLRLYLISTSLSTVSLSIWQLQKKMLFQPVPLFMSYVSIFSLILSVPSCFKNVFHPFICMTKCSSPVLRNVSVSLTYPVDILSGHLDWGQMPRPVAEPIDRGENQGQRWLRNTTA